MIAQPIYPFRQMHGKITEHYYIRTAPNGKHVVCKCPNRKGHVPTEKERANRQTFVERYAKGNPTERSRCGPEEGRGDRTLR